MHYISMAPAVCEASAMLRTIMNAILYISKVLKENQWQISILNPERSENMCNSLLPCVAVYLHFPGYCSSKRLSPYTKAGLVVEGDVLFRMSPLLFMPLANKKRACRNKPFTIKPFLRKAKIILPLIFPIENS